MFPGGAPPFRPAHYLGCRYGWCPRFSNSNLNVAYIYIYIWITNSNLNVAHWATTQTRIVRFWTMYLECDLRCYVWTYDSRTCGAPGRIQQLALLWMVIHICISITCIYIYIYMYILAVIFACAHYNYKLLMMINYT